MIGSRVGSKSTLRGAKVGSSADDESQAAAVAWTVDAASG